MRIVCAPTSVLEDTSAYELGIILYDSVPSSIGARIPDIVRRKGLEPSTRAWDLLSIALAVVGADLRVPRENSPDGWTRRLDLEVAVSDPEFWNSQSELVTQQLRFLTTDIWNISFFKGVNPSSPVTRPIYIDQDSVVLLSGGLDSLIGAIDIVRHLGRKPYAVSQITKGDKQTQRKFASAIGHGLAHLQLNHDANFLGQNERSQRARSIAFLSYGVLLSTALTHYLDGREVTLYVCENGFISLNPPMTGSRLGSLSTRTTHPLFVRLFQQLLASADIRVRLENPYQYKTKGEMIRTCTDQALLQENASISISCGRYARHGYKHCGRCVPCLIRRAAFHASDIPDNTEYVYADLARDDDAHARYDDVRSVAMAVATAETEGVSNWARPVLSSAVLGDVTDYTDLVTRGIRELGAFLRSERVA